MSDRTIILLAVKKGMDLNKFLSQRAKENYPEDFFKFTKNENEVEKILKWFRFDLEYLKKVYDLYINIIYDLPHAEDWGEKTEEQLEEIIFKRYEQMDDFAKNITSKETNEVLLVYQYSDGLQNLFDFTPPLLYDKEDIAQIFSTDNQQLIKSLIDNGILIQLEFTEEELVRLRNLLPFSLKFKLFAQEYEKLILIKDINKEEYFTHLNPIYSHLFGKEYVDFLLYLRYQRFIAKYPLFPALLL